MGYKKYRANAMYPVLLPSTRQIGWYCKKADNRYENNRDNWRIYIDKNWRYMDQYLSLNVFYFPRKDCIWYQNSELVHYVEDYDKEARLFMGWPIY